MSYTHLFTIIFFYLSITPYYLPSVSSFLNHYEWGLTSKSCSQVCHAVGLSCNDNFFDSSCGTGKFNYMCGTVDDQYTYAGERITCSAASSCLVDCHHKKYSMSSVNDVVNCDTIPACSNHNYMQICACVPNEFVSPAPTIKPTVSIPETIIDPSESENNPNYLEQFNSLSMSQQAGFVLFVLFLLITIVILFISVCSSNLYKRTYLPVLAEDNEELEQMQKEVDEKWKYCFLFDCLHFIFCCIWLPPEVTRFFKSTAETVSEKVSEMMPDVEMNCISVDDMKEMAQQSVNLEFIKNPASMVPSVNMNCFADDDEDEVEESEPSKKKKKKKDKKYKKVSTSEDTSLLSSSTTSKDSEHDKSEHKKKKKKKDKDKEKDSSEHKK